MPRSLFDTAESDSVERPPDAVIADAKQRHPGMVLLFRVGDNYELFDDDAELAARLLGLKLCSASRPISRFPVESLQTQLRRLLPGGHRIAICEWERVNDPSSEAAHVGRWDTVQSG